MSADLAPTFDAATIERQLAALEEYIESTTDQADLLNAVDRARIIKTLAKAQKGAESVARCAIRVEVLALRRLAQLGHYVKGKRSIQEWLASLSHTDLGLVLDAGRTATSAYRDMLKKQADDRSESWRSTDPREQWDRIASQGFSPYSDPGNPWATQGLAEAAHVVLSSAMTDERPFTTSEVTASLIEQLNADPDLAPALAEAVREAVRSSAVDMAGPHGRAVPKIITFYDDQHEWVHVPWTIATLGQLRWMAEFRADQARQLQQRADDLARLVDRLSLLGDDSTTLAQIVVGDQQSEVAA